MNTNAPRGALLRTFPASLLDFSLFLFRHRSHFLRPYTSAKESRPLKTPRLDMGPTLLLPYPFSAKKGPLLSLPPSKDAMQREEKN